MQVPPLPPVTVPNATLPQEAVAKAVPQVIAQASAPVIQRAVDPSQKSDRGQNTRSNSDRAKGGGKAAASGGRGGSVNFKV